MTDIYEQHDKAFAKVSAFVILKDGERVATVAIKFPTDGAGRLWAYTHFLGAPMTRHHADGYGYDKRSPAVIGGFAKAAFERAEPMERLAKLRDFRAALGSDDGEYWDRKLEKAGYQVLQAV